MADPDEVDWVRRLAPLVIDGEPLAAQLRRRFGAAIVASALIAGLLAFFLLLFAGFEHGRIGLIIDLAICPAVAWIWLGYFRMRRAIAAYGRAGDPPGRGAGRGPG